MNGALMRLLGSVLFVALVLWTTGAAAADGIETRPLKFARNASSATVSGTIRGAQTVDYKLRARSGQTMTVKLDSRHAGLAFNVLPPGSDGVALPDAIGLQSWSAALPANGEYTIRTYLPRSAARRGERANYKLTVGVTGASASSLTDAVARASRGQFNATGQIPCAQALGQPMGQCPFGVARAGGGTATLVVTLPDGRKRALFFDKGQATAADLSQADGNMKFRATKRADLFMIDAGNERYEVPEAAIFGG